LIEENTNQEAFYELDWYLKNATRGFCLFTASHLMQNKVVEHYRAPGVAVYDYSKHPAPYSFSTLAQWAEEQEARVFFVVNMQIALRKRDDMYNLNFSRDHITNIPGIWVFGMDEATDNRLVKIAVDFYSFFRVRVRFEDEGIDEKTIQTVALDLPETGYYESYEEAHAQIERYVKYLDEYMSLPLDTEPQRLLSATKTLRNIANMYFKYGYYNDALNIYERIKLISEHILGYEHPNTGSYYNDIALVYKNKGDYPKALELLQKVLLIAEKALGLEHPNTVATYNNIASLYNDLSEYDKSMEWHQKALEINEKVLGLGHLNTATLYNNIASRYSNQGDYPKALEWHQKALEIREKKLGLEHPDTATSYNNIAYVYNNQSDYPKALEWHQKALEIREKKLGLEHPNTAISYSNIAIVYDNQGDYLKALEWFQKALVIYEKVFGMEHPNTLKIKDRITFVKNKIH
jgi:tetratricopeptide (TPR) repeat protein